MEFTFNVAQLSKLLDVDEEHFKSFVNDEGEPIEEASAEILAQILDHNRDLREESKGQGIKIGERRKGQGVETSLSEAFKTLGIKNPKRAEEGIKLIVEKVKEISESGGDDLTDEKIVSHPLFQQKLNEKTDDYARQIEEKDKRFAEFEAKVKADAVNSRAINRARNILLEKGAPSEYVEARLNTLFKAGYFEGLSEDDEGEFLFLTEEGSPKRNKAGQKIRFDSHVVSSYEGLGWAFQKGKPGGQGGPPKPGGGGGDPTKITSREELESRLSKAKDGKERAEIMMSYEPADE